MEAIAAELAVKPRFLGAIAGVDLLCVLVLRNCDFAVPNHVLIPFFYGHVAQNSVPALPRNDFVTVNCDFVPQSIELVPPGFMLSAFYFKLVAFGYDFAAPSYDQLARKLVILWQLSQNHHFFDPPESQTARLRCPKAGGGGGWVWEIYLAAALASLAWALAWRVAAACWNC